MATLASSGACVIKAGANVNFKFVGDVTTEATWTALINQAEGAIIVKSGVNWVDGYAGYNADWKQILEDCCACWCGIQAIAYDMSGYTNIEEARTMCDVLRDRFHYLLSVISSDEAQKFMGVK